MVPALDAGGAGVLQLRLGAGVQEEGRARRGGTGCAPGDEPCRSREPTPHPCPAAPAARPSPSLGQSSPKRSPWGADVGEGRGISSWGAARAPLGEPVRAEAAVVQVAQGDGRRRRGRRLLRVAEPDLAAGRLGGRRRARNRDRGSLASTLRFSKPTTKKESLQI